MAMMTARETKAALALGTGALRRMRGGCDGRLEQTVWWCIHCSTEDGPCSKTSVGGDISRASRLTDAGLDLPLPRAPQRWDPARINE
jgi:hypothetical protein